MCGYGDRLAANLARPARPHRARQDLAGYRTFKDKGVMIAARGFINAVRAVHPTLLKKKDRGRLTGAGGCAAQPAAAGCSHVRGAAACLCFRALFQTNRWRLARTVS